MVERRGLRAHGVVAGMLTLVALDLVLLGQALELDDTVDAQYAAYARVSGSLAVVGTRSDVQAASAAGRAVQRLLDAGLPAEATEPLVARYDAWAAAPRDGRALAALREETAALGEQISRRQTLIGLSVLGLQVLALTALTGLFLGWLARFSRAHRAREDELATRYRQAAGDQMLLALVHNSADVIAVLDQDSTVQFVSPSAATVLGILPERLVGQRLVDLLTSLDAATLARHLVTQRAGDHPVDLRMRMDDGRARVLDGTLANLTGDPSVGGWVLTVRDVTDRHLLEEQIAQQALHDGLTGLANRQLFRDRLEHALARRTARPEALAVLICDLDDFRDVNDSRGHDVGDRLLVEVAERLRRVLGPGDTAARLGADEFAVLLEGSDLRAAERVAHQVQAELAEPVLVGDAAIAVRLSIGVAQADPQAEARADGGLAVLRNADVAVSWAKERGKATVAVYEPGLHALALERMTLRADLQQALRDGQFTLHFQPTIDLVTEEITGFEALVRWDHPGRGLMAPQTFISIAEQSGLIVELGTWVLHEACRAAVSLQMQAYRPTMAVNIAAQQVVRTDFVDQVLAALDDSGLPARYLVLEITESVLVEDMEGVVERLAHLRDLGVNIAIDDFGTGYSSLAYLSRLPVDILKVDKTFVDEVCAGNHGASVTEAILAMSQTMRLVTVAEGVELPEQAAWLESAACTMGQGYLWSRPVELDGARHLLRSGVPRQRSRHRDRPRPRHLLQPAAPVHRAEPADQDAPSTGGYSGRRRA